MKEMVLSAPGFIEMSVDDAFGVEGGRDWDIGDTLQVAGVAIMACSPAAGPAWPLVSAVGYTVYMVGYMISNEIEVSRTPNGGGTISYCP